VLDVGFQISFLTVGVLILALNGAWERSGDGKMRLKQRAIQILIASTAAWIATMPLIAYHFGQVSLLSIPATLLIGFAIPLIIGLSLSGWLTSFLLAPIGVGLMIPAQYLAGYLLAVVEGLGSLKFAAIATPPFSGYWLPMVYGAALMVWRPRARPAP
jgi:competence protein ComEC